MLFVCLFSFFFTSTDEVKDLLLTETRFNTFRLQVANFLPLIVKRGTFSLLAEALIDLKGESHSVVKIRIFFAILILEKVSSDLYSSMDEIENGLYFVPI